MARRQSPSATVARKLRRQETEAERLLWQQLRDRQLNGLKFRRQVPIEGYVADFVCLEARLIIELDGGQHSIRLAEDSARTEVLERAGFRVLRFWNNDVLSNRDGVLASLIEELKWQGTWREGDAPHPVPLPVGEGTPAPTLSPESALASAKGMRGLKWH